MTDELMKIMHYYYYYCFFLVNYDFKVIHLRKINKNIKYDNQPTDK